MNMNKVLQRITLIGVGLIGGSFVLDLKRFGRVIQVSGIDLDADNLERALERGVIDEAHTVINRESIGDSELILIATPVTTLPQICGQLADVLPLNAVVSDVGSTKQSALVAFRQYLPDHFARCVAVHPIAGSDRSGALAAQFGLYRGKKLIVCPHQSQHQDSVALIESLWGFVGAEIHIMDAVEHDAIFAAVSHLPHLLAFAYMNQIIDSTECMHYLQFAGSGFRDFTRIAASSPQMWADIALENRDALLALLVEQQKQLGNLQNLLNVRDRDGLCGCFEQVSRIRRQWEEQQ